MGEIESMVWESLNFIRDARESLRTNCVDCANERCTKHRELATRLMLLEYALQETERMAKEVRA